MVEVRDAMKPPPFEYVAADSVEAALAALSAADGQGKILAGGQSLMPMLNFRLARPSVLVDINRIDGLAYLREETDAIHIGALTRHRVLEASPAIAQHLPVVAEAMAHVAHMAIRNRGTIGGSLSHADPAAELPMMALLLDATIRIASATGTREEAAADFFRSALTTSLGLEEMVTEVVVPKLPTGTGWGFEEVARRGGDFALAAVAALLTVRDERIAEARIAMMGVGETPLRAHAAEALLTGKAVGGVVPAEIIAAVRAACSPNTDLHASADYRRHLVGVLAGRALIAAWQRATDRSGHR
jgi:CO/xanthine dehydrogenase FAD-binding subunit